MAFINKELFVSELVAFPALARGIPVPVGHRALREGFAAKPDRTNALRLLSSMREFVVGGQTMGKGCRPWDITSKIFDKLDRSKPWWGFEFETGWRSAAARSQAIAHTWDNFDGVMFDGEGEGLAPVEITFTPAEAQDHFNGKAPAVQFVKWMEENSDLVSNGGANNVGTHFNVSDPRFTDAGTVEALCRFLNRSLKFTVRKNGERLKMFGRESVYAGFFHNISNGGKNQWLEFKGFRTAYTVKEFDNYLNTCKAFQRVIDFYFVTRAQIRSDMGVSNLFDIAFGDARPALASMKDIKIDRGAAPLYTRYMGGENAGCII